MMVIMSTKLFAPVVIGQRQVLRELKNDSLEKILLATDADANYSETILNAAKKAGVQVSVASTSQQIADEYGVKVKSAVVGFLKA